MYLRLRVPRFIDVDSFRFNDFFDPLLFLFFFTLHADQLNMIIGSYTIRINNLLGLLLFIVFLCRFPLSTFTFNKKLLSGFGGLTLVFFLSSILSPFRERCIFFFFWYLATVCFYFVFPYLLAKQLGTQKILKFYLASFFLVGFTAGCQLILSFFGCEFVAASQLIHGTIVRPNAFAYEPSFYALYMTPFVVYMQVLFLLKGNVSKKQILLVNGLFLISTATSTLFCYFILLVVLLLCGWISPFKENLKHIKRTLFLWACSFGCLFVLILLISPEFAKKFYFKFFIQDFRSHHSFYERWAGIWNAWKVFLEHPLLGVGLGGIPPYLCEAWMTNEAGYQFFFQDQGFAFEERVLKLFEPSNVFTELLASAGIICMIPMGYLIFSLFRLAFKAYKHLNSLSERKEVIALFISFVVGLIVLQFNQGIFRTYVWTHFALVYAFIEMMMKEKGKEYQEM